MENGKKMVIGSHGQNYLATMNDDGTYISTEEFGRYQTKL